MSLRFRLLKPVTLKRFGNAAETKNILDRNSAKEKNIAFWRRYADTSILKTGLNGIIPQEAYLRTFVEASGHKFSTDSYINNAINIKTTDKDVLGISSFYTMRSEVMAALEYAKSNNKYIVIGGPTVSLRGDLGKEIRKEICELYDGAIVLRGMQMLGQVTGRLLDAIEAHEDLKGVPSITYSSNGQIIENPILDPEDRINADDCYDLLEKIIKNKVVRNRPLEVRSWHDQAVYFGMRCSWGHCSFCANDLINDMSFSGSISAQKMVEIAQSGIKKGINYFRLIDQDAMAYPHIWEALINSTLPGGIWFDASIRTHGIINHQDLIGRILDRFNLRLRWGADSGSDKVLAEMNKDCTAEQNYRAIEILSRVRNKSQKHELAADAYTIDLWPNMNISDFKEHLNFISKLLYANISLVKPCLNKLDIMPGSKIYKDKIEELGIKKNFPWELAWAIEDEKLKAIYHKFGMPSLKLGAAYFLGNILQNWGLDLNVNLNISKYFLSSLNGFANKV